MVYYTVECQILNLIHQQHNQQRTNFDKFNGASVLTKLVKDEGDNFLTYGYSGTRTSLSVPT